MSMKSDRYDADIATSLIAKYDARPEMLVQILRSFLEQFGWISEAAIRQLAAELNLSRADVHGVVSYYHDFRTTPPGRHVIKICQAEACQAMGSRALTEHAEGTLGIAMRNSSDELTLEPVYCLGVCSCSPAIMIDGHPHGRVSAQRFDELVSALGDSH